MTSVHLYQAQRPYLPLLACALHLNLAAGSDSFVAAGLRHDWRAAPLFVAGPDSCGAIVCCLVHGRRRELYSRTMEGLSGLFGITLTRLDIDRAMSNLTLADKMQANLAVWLPTGYGKRNRSAVASLIQPLINKSRGD